MRQTQPTSTRPRSAPSAPAGVLTHWIASLTPAQRARLLDLLVRADVALASTLGGYERTARVPRMCFLLMNECAIARALNVGELAMLFPKLERDAVCALEGLARTRDAETSRNRRGEQHANTH